MPDLRQLVLFFNNCSSARRSPLHPASVGLSCIAALAFRSLFDFLVSVFIAAVFSPFRFFRNTVFSLSLLPSATCGFSLSLLLITRTAKISWMHACCSRLSFSQLSVSTWLFQWTREPSTFSSRLAKAIPVQHLDILDRSTIPIQLGLSVGSSTLSARRSRHDDFSHPAFHPRTPQPGSSDFAAEVQSARNVQQYLIPEQLPDTPGLAIESVYRPSREVGGDFFQVLPNATDGSALIVVGDVAGKGMQAGMLATLIVGAIRTAASFTNDPGRILSLLNERMRGRGSRHLPRPAHRERWQRSCWPTPVTCRHTSMEKSYPWKAHYPRRRSRHRLPASSLQARTGRLAHAHDRRRR